MPLNIGITRPGLNIASQSNREHRKISQEGEVTVLGPLARESTNIISDVASEVQMVYTCVTTACKVNPIALQAFGAIACLNFPLGVLAANEAHSEALAHRKVQNFWAECTAWLKCVTGAMQAAAGAFNLPAQALTVALFYVASKTMTIAATVLGGASMGLFGGAALLFGISTGMDLHRQLSFRQELEAFSSKEEALRYLKQRLETKGTLEMIRLTGAESAERILNAEEADASEVLKLVIKENDKTIALSAIGMALLLLGAVPAVLSVVLTGGTAGLVVIVLCAIVGLAWLGLDLYNFIQAMRADEQGKYDRIWLLITTLICSLATGATLYLTQGPLLLLFCLAISITWLLINLSSCIALSQKSSESLSSGDGAVSL